jgi:NAD(P)-dependent dehydrogenase (short-subunit alcohol dehydrogenase family)
MMELNGKTAIVSGAAEGIGFGIAEEVGRLGMNVVIADINAEQLEAARKKLEQQGVAVLAVSLDVANCAQWREVAKQAIDRFGKVHMLVNNAGVGGAPSPIESSTEKDWRWIVDVNLMGVVNGAQTVIPLIKEHGEGGWVVNVASMAGFVSLPMASAYSATKAAVVAMSESWHAELQESNIHVSVLCPGFVKTRINKSHRNKQAQYQSDEGAGKGKSSSVNKALGAQMQSVIDAGSPPALIAARVVEALVAKELYIVTHPSFYPAVASRFKGITGAFERAKSSVVLADVVEQKILGFE